MKTEQPDGLPFEEKISSTELFENHHWKQNLLNSMSSYNPLINVSDISDIQCQPGGERPLTPSKNDGWAFILILAGKGKMDREPGRKFKPGELLIIPPKVRISFQVLEGPCHVCRFLIQDSGALQDLFSQEITVPEVVHPRAPELLQQCFERAFHLLKQQNGRTPLLAAAEAFIFLSEIRQQCFGRNIPESFEYVCKEISSFPTRHYTLSKLAAACGMSVRSFQRRFVREYACTPQTFIMVNRLTLARRFLRSSRLPVQDIAVRCRFHSAAQFSKSFKKYIGLSPREYRRKFHDKDAEFYQMNQRKFGTNRWNLLPDMELTGQQRQILWCLIENDQITPKKIASLLNIPIRDVKSDLQKLNELDCLHPLRSRSH